LVFYATAAVQTTPAPTNDGTTAAATTESIGCFNHMKHKRQRCCHRNTGTIAYNSQMWMVKWCWS